MYKQTDD